MTVETARRILAAAPQVQARSDTALDRLMQGAPAPLAAGNPASDTNKDYLIHLKLYRYKGSYGDKEEFNHYQPLGK
ncbi:hypothetical protein ECZU12_49230 [Escherichia coli]|nr:hypothetical protein ECZU12_49230 [Escherichia coli]